MISKERAHALRNMIEKAAVSLDDSDALEAVELFPNWTEEGVYEVNDRVRYENVLYKCLQNHMSQSSWTPQYSPSLWVRVDNPVEEWPEWIQPLGSTDAYLAGAKVTHNEKHWISEYDANIWEPGVFGWSEVN